MDVWIDGWVNGWMDGWSKYSVIAAQAEISMLGEYREEGTKPM